VNRLQKLVALLNAVRHDALYFCPLADAIRMIPWRRARAARRLVAVRPYALNGHPVWVRLGTTDDQTLRNALLKRYHLPYEPLGPQPCICDLGSNVGYTVAHMAIAYPSARIFGVEMDADNFALAQWNTAGLNGCTLLHAAVAATTGEISYRKGGGEDGYSVALDRPAADGAPEVRVEAVSPSDLLERLALDVVDYVKMDIEGEEMRLLDPAADLAWLTRVRQFGIEVHTGDHGIAALVAVLQDHGFEAQRDDRHWAAVRATRR
jgi:FkbM family methyltransferase